MDRFSISGCSLKLLLVSQLRVIYLWQTAMMIGEH
jgi:hypothetical protein